MTPAWHRRMEIWRHNGMRGHARMMEAQLRNMLTAETLTAEAKAQVVVTLEEVEVLKKLLKTRRVP